MRNKILKININNLIVNTAGEAEMITKACQREIPMQVSGLCQIGENLLVIFEECDSIPDVNYVFARFESENVDEITAEISARFYSGFSMLGGFDIKREKWALFQLNKTI
jgi:hypothetical protein